MMSATRNVRRSTLLLMAQEMRERVGAAIRARRKAQGIGPTQFAQLMNTSIKTVERWERGETNGAMQHLDKIAAVLELEPQELTAYPESDQPADPEPLTLTADDSERLKHIERMLEELLRTSREAAPAREDDGGLADDLDVGGRDDEDESQSGRARAQR